MPWRQARLVLSGAQLADHLLGCVSRVSNAANPALGSEVQAEGSATRASHTNQHLTRLKGSRWLTEVVDLPLE